MATTAFLYTMYQAVKAVLNLLPQASFDSQIGLALNSVLPWLTIFNSMLPLDTLFLILGLVMLNEFTVFALRLFLFAWNLVRGSGA